MATGEFDGRVVIVTGAGSGIGRASALGFAADGASVVVNDIDEATAQATVDEITSAGGVAHAHAADVGDSAAVDELVDGAVARFGRLDVLHNNAGYGLPGRVDNTSDETFAEMLRVNLCGVLYGTRAALRHMIEQRSGVIVNTASNAALGAPRDRAAYGSAKAGVIGLTRSTAVENGRYGVRAVAICPGPIETPAFLRFAPDPDFYRAQIPIRRLGRPGRRRRAGPLPRVRPRRFPHRRRHLPRRRPERQALRPLPHPRRDPRSSSVSFWRGEPAICVTSCQNGGVDGQETRPFQLRASLTTSLNGLLVSNVGSRGSPSTRSPIPLRCISLVPPAMAMNRPLR